jgi:C1A family cysteine protease
MNSINYKWNFMPSALDLYAKVRLVEGMSLTDDSGAEIRDIFTVLNQQGVCPEDSNQGWSWPFSASDNRWQLMPPPACEKEAALHKVLKYERISSVNEIKSSINKGFPVVIGVSIYDSFESDEVAHTGVVPIPGDSEECLGGHCMFIWGYIKDSAYVRNSWGDKWGIKGDCQIPLEYFIDSDLTSDLYSVQLMT